MVMVLGYRLVMMTTITMVMMMGIGDWWWWWRVFSVTILQVITDDDVDRISLCVRVVAERTPLMNKIFTEDCRGSLSAMLEAGKKEDEQLKQKSHADKALAVQADDPISFLQLLAKSDAGVFEVRGGLLVGALDVGARGPGLSPGFAIELYEHSIG